MTLHEKWMSEALAQASLAREMGEIPVGCVIVKDGAVVGRGHNLRERENRTIGHAEIMAIEDACRNLGSWRLDGCDLYVTLEPCTMCAGAILQSRLSRVFYGAADPAEGAVHGIVRLFDLPYKHRPDCEGGVLEAECRQLLEQFFEEKRAKNR